MQRFDMVIIGGGVMGCTTALHLARGGMRCAIVERGGLCREASGRNAGTLTPMYTYPQLVPHAMRGRDMWKTSAGWLGGDAGFVEVEGLALTFTEEKAQAMRAAMVSKCEQGAPIEIIGANAARAIEPGIGPELLIAAHCTRDGYADSNRIGRLFRAALLCEGVALFEVTRATGVERLPAGYAIRVANREDPIETRGITITGGAWIEEIAGWFGVDIPLVVRLDQGTITERMRPAMRTQMLVYGELSLKQFPNGTVIMGGGRMQHWIDNADESPEKSEIWRVNGKMLAAMRAATLAIPAVSSARVVRTWTGLEGYTVDDYPVIGPLSPAAPDVFIMGCARSGFTTGPFLGKCLADEILGRKPEQPIFLDEFTPDRFAGSKRVDAATRNAA